MQSGVALADYSSVRGKLRWNVAGEKETGILQKSVQKLNTEIFNSKLLISNNMKQGELSLVHTAVLFEPVNSFFNDN